MGRGGAFEEDEELQVILPEGSLYPNSDVASDLVLLTRLIEERYKTTHHGGGLGGEYGYGTNYENSTFLMNSFCWCESQTCPWCVGCECPEEAYHYFVDEKEVGYDEWMAFFDREVGDMFSANSQEEHEAWEIRAQAANARRGERHDPECEFCLTGGVAATKGGGPGQGAPNFWHKDSGVKVWFYKWIGRSMEFEGPVEKWAEIFSDTLDSIGGPPTF
jgi:hypothetical protein